MFLFAKSAETFCISSPVIFAFVLSDKNSGIAPFPVPRSTILLTPFPSEIKFEISRESKEKLK